MGIQARFRLLSSLDGPGAGLQVNTLSEPKMAGCKANGPSIVRGIPRRIRL